VQGHFRHNVTRDLGFHLGYGREDYFQRGDAREYKREFIDLGADYNREISIARRTRLRFATMTGMIQEGEGDKHFRVEGFVSLRTAFRRTWHAEIAADRRTEFLPGFFAPMFSDTVNAALGGMLATRLQWAVVATGGRGRVGLESESTFRSAAAATKFSFALTRTLGTYIHYQYFVYDAPPGPAHVLGPLGQNSRQSLVAGLNVWVPLYERMKVLRDPE
jgi:hypothetical protein